MARFLKLALFLVMVISIAVSAQAQEARVVTDDEVNIIAGKLYCPVCENITLDACGTAACADWRYEIRLQLESGMTEEQIIQDFVHRFGDRVVGTPLDPALRAMSLYTPWLVVAGALIAAGFVVAKRRGGQLPPMPANDAPTNRFADQFEQDLRN